ncbi:MAG TPA: NAD(P)H-binding protein [Spongiibacteraceae bacterium]|nr:NAD(P)H-binding protein [Spongiibacteraceae bacterium]
MSTRPARPPRLLIIGCGDIGNGVGQTLAARGWQVWGLRRDPARIDPAIQALAGDVTAPATLAGLAALAPDHVLVTLTPGARSAEAYRAVYEQGAANLLAALAGDARPHTLWVSSTSVYHQHNGEWLDESSAAEGAGATGKSLLAAEQLMQQALPTTVLRCAGIYGPGRNRLLSQVREGRVSPEYPVQYSNRIHRDDVVGFIVHLLQQRAAGRRLQDCYIGVDDLPAPLAEVQRWLAAQLGIDTVVDQSLRHQRASKRLSNQRLKDSGYQLQYPDYRAGYGAMLREPDAPC